MSLADGVSDSTDWLNTPLAALAPIESSLRCQVCKDFYSTPMMTSCSHTFCSLCIRRYLSQEGRCPACRESDQEIKLRRNWVVEELVTQFQAGRDNMLKFARSRVSEERPAKRRRIDTVHHEGQERRSTRSQSKRIVSSQDERLPSTPQEVPESDEGSEYEDTPKKKQDMKEGLVICPICSKKVKEALINAHIDSNCSSHRATSSSPRRSNTPQTTSLAHGPSKPTTTVTVRDRLPTINYSMLSETALRRKLRDLNIPSHGSKELMRKRHTEWMNLWNANCDARDPVPPKQLLHDLDRWERTLGRQVDKGPSGVMLKEFDRDSWQKTNQGDFKDLIRKARESKKTTATAAAAAAAKSDVKETKGELGEQVNAAEEGGLDVHGTDSAVLVNGTAKPDDRVEVPTDISQDVSQPFLNLVSVRPLADIDADAVRLSGTDVDQMQTH